MAVEDERGLAWGRKEGRGEGDGGCHALTVEGGRGKGMPEGCIMKSSVADLARSGDLSTCVCAPRKAKRVEGEREGEEEGEGEGGGERERERDGKVMSPQVIAQGAVRERERAREREREKERESARACPFVRAQRIIMLTYTYTHMEVHRIP